MSIYRARLRNTSNALEGGYISLENVGSLNKILCKAKRYGLTDSLLTFSELMEQSDEQSLSRVVFIDHYFFNLLGNDNSQLQIYVFAT